MLISLLYHQNHLSSIFCMPTDTINSFIQKRYFKLKCFFIFFHEISNFMEIHHYFSPNDLYSRTFTMSFTKTISLIEFTLNIDMTSSLAF